MLRTQRIRTLCYAPGEIPRTGQKTPRKEKAPRLWCYVREFAPPGKASDTEAAEQCCEPSAYALCAMRRVRFLVRVTRPQEKKKHHVCGAFLWSGDPYGNRTHVTAVKGPCLNRLTNGPKKYVEAEEGFDIW